MQNAQNIYYQAIAGLPSDEKLRLAAMILQDLTDENGMSEQTSALEFLENLPQEKIFNSAEEVDRHLKTERESWDS